MTEVSLKYTIHSHSIFQVGMGGDLVALWEVRLSDGVHKVGFEHGTTTGRRVLWVDGEVSGDLILDKS